MQKLLPIIFLLISVISLLTLMRHTSFQNNIQQQSRQSVLLPAGTTDDVKIAVIAFYSDYDACLKTQSSVDARNYCLAHNTSITNELRTKALAATTDLFICSTSSPLSYVVKDVVITPNKAQAKLKEMLPGFSQSVTVELAAFNTTWKITNILCPHS